MTLTYASCRRDFWGDTVAMPLDRVRWESAEPNFEPGQRILVLIHGYRTDEGSIRAAYSTIANRMAAHYDHVIGFVWPGGWTRVGFWPSERRAKAANLALQWLMEQIYRADCVVDVQTHSLGALVYWDDPRWFPRNVLLTAPAVNDDVLTSPESRQIQKPQQANRLYIYHSRRDPVLGWWYRLARLGLHGALGLKGPKDPERIPENVRVIDCSRVVTEHGGYRRSEEFFAHWERELTKPGTRQFEELG